MKAKSIYIRLDLSMHELQQNNTNKIDVYHFLYVIAKEIFSDQIFFIKMLSNNIMTKILKIQTWEIMV